MSIISQNLKFAKEAYSGRNMLAAFNPKTEKPTEVEYGMTPDQIADIISEKLMVIVRAQFEATRIKFEAEQQAKAQAEEKA